MLRTYKPISHEIFTLHNQLEHLVCQVWCGADNTPCIDLLTPDFEIIYNSYDWLKNDIDTIYEKCKLLSDKERADIREAFVVNNRIEELCSGTINPISLASLPTVVTDYMKPLLVKFYEYLLDRAEVAGDKLDYYNKLIQNNRFTTCPCCGLIPIESAESHYREDNDHYLPKSDFPFASVNFNNLVPLCSKCNKKCKGSKNPVENSRKAFYPFNINHNEINVDISIIDNDNLNYIHLKDTDIKITFDSDSDKTETWNWLFNIKERYNEETRKFSKSELRIIANRLFRNAKRKQGLSYNEIIDDTIEDYEIDKYEDRKFLKIAFLTEMKSKPEWMAVYQV
jgi:hypothetical protein